MFLFLFSLIFSISAFGESAFLLNGKDITKYEDIGSLNELVLSKKDKTYIATIEKRADRAFCLASALKELAPQMTENPLDDGWLSKNLDIKTQALLLLLQALSENRHQTFFSLVDEKNRVDNRMNYIYVMTVSDGGFKLTSRNFPGFIRFLKQALTRIEKGAVLHITRPGLSFGHPAEKSNWLRLEPAHENSLCQDDYSTFDQIIGIMTLKEKGAERHAFMDYDEEALYDIPRPRLLPAAFLTDNILFFVIENLNER